MHHKTSPRYCLIFKVYFGTLSVCYTGKLKTTKSRSKTRLTASRMRSLYAFHLSLSVAIPAIQPRLRLSGT
ncbi:MAG: hypothetical protein KZQ71_08230 [Candidatus Thiodiazotropha sp. (ex Lucinoma aequizonata)]|nr:hypothetical protein [Candidatus Thiodiazotropha sp. (ex Lucinoma aequizonata)]